MRSERNVLVWAASAAMLAVGSAAAQQVTVQQIDNTGSLSTTPWSDTLVVNKFTLPSYARLDQIDWVASGVISARGTVVNSSNFSIYPSINANSTIRFSGLVPGISVNVPIYASGSSIVSAHGSGSVFASGDGSASGVVPAADHARFLGTGTVAFPVTADTGSVIVSGGGAVSSRQLTAFGGVQVNYRYTPVGLTQADSIVGTNISGGRDTFAAIPSGRWVDPATNSAYSYESQTAGGTFTGVSFPTGRYASYDVTANGTALGRFNQGATFSFPGTGVSSFSVFGVDPVTTPLSNSFPLALGYSVPTMSFVTTPVPEPASLLTTATVGVFALVGLRNRRRGGTTGRKP